MANLLARSTITIEAHAADVWRALVDPAAIKAYMFGTDVASDWRVGGPITWGGVWKGKPYEDKGVILRLEPARALSYSHFSPLSGQADVPANYHTVTIELAARDAETVVTLTQDGNASEQERLESERNWETMLAGLRKYVEG